MCISVPAVHSVGVDNCVENVVHCLAHLRYHVRIACHLAGSCSVDHRHRAVPDIGTADQTIRYIHILAETGEVRDGHAAHTALTAEISCLQIVVLAAPLCTPAVEAGHDAPCAAVDDRAVSDLKIKLTCCLLIEPCVDASSGCLGIIQCYMLQVYINALGLDALRLSCADRTRCERIFRIILKVTAGIRCSVHVDTRSVKSRITHVKAVVADAASDIFHQFKVHSCGHDIFRCVAHSGLAADQRCGETLRAIFIFCSCLGYALAGCRVVETECDGVDHLFKLKLIQQLLPALIIVICADQLGDGHCSAGSECRHSSIGMFLCFVLNKIKSCCKIVVHCKFLACCRECSLPVAAA